MHIFGAKNFSSPSFRITLSIKLKMVKFLRVPSVKLFEIDVAQSVVRIDIRVMNYLDYPQSQIPVKECTRYY
jgi:hypothetical protein